MSTRRKDFAVEPEASRSLRQEEEASSETESWTEEGTWEVCVAAAVAGVVGEERGPRSRRVRREVLPDPEGPRRRTVGREV